MKNTANGQYSLFGKIKINAVIRLETGMHIGSSSDFAPIGAVDRPFIRDTFTKQPIIPGTSLKGKLRTMLAKSYADGILLNDITQDTAEIKRIFGSAGNNEAKAARLQVADCRMTDKSVEQLSEMDTDTYLGEIKFENSINRLTAIAKPRQLERVPAGAEFAMTLVYNVEAVDEMADDIKFLADGLKLLEMDYIGGHGSRGYGRISFHNFTAEAFSIIPEQQQILEKEIDNVVAMLKGDC